LASPSSPRSSRRAFKRGYVDSWWTRFEHFRDNLAQAGTEQGRAQWIADDEPTPFGDTITELSCWAGFRKEDPDAERRGRNAGLPRGSLIVDNSLREPGPCGVTSHLVNGEAVPLD
jgi:hypothetical protein